MRGKMETTMTPAEVWKSLAFCAVCGKDVELKPITFEAPKDKLPEPLVSDGKRTIMGAKYFRDPFHNPTLPFENYCSAECSNYRLSAITSL